MPEFFDISTNKTYDMTGKKEIAIIKTKGTKLRATWVITTTS